MIERYLFSIEMKKIKCLFLMLLISTAFIHSQDQESKSVQIGVRAGLNISNLYTNGATGSDIIPGYNAGFFARVSLNDFIGFQPELSLTTKGAIITYNNLFANGTANFNLTYLEIPLLCVMNVTPLVNFQLGPYIGYLLDSSVKNKANIRLFDFERDMNMNNFNRIDVGLVAGVGLDVDNITMGLRYNLGLTKVGKSQSYLGTNYTIPDSKNAVISFYLSVSFI
jgi:hypothetical protein